MASLGSLVADLSLNYSEFQAGLKASQQGMGGWNQQTSTWLSVTGSVFRRTFSGMAQGAATAARGTGSAASAIARGTGAMAGGFTRMAGAAANAYMSWRMHSARMRTEILQQKLLMEQIRQSRSQSSGTGIGIGGIGIGTALGGMIGQVSHQISSIPSMGIKLAADAEQAQIAFEVMLGSGEKAGAMLAQLKAYSDKSPFNVTGVNAAAQKLLNYNIQAQDVLPTIKLLGDVAAGDMEKFDRLSTSFGQMSATGRLMGQDLLQFINAGFNPLQEISRKTGESMTVLKKRMEDGGISAYEVRDAFISATSEGGRFYGMTDRQSSTLAGKWSTLKDSVSTALRGVGEALVTNLDLSGWLDYVTNFTNRIPFLFANAGTLLQLEMLNWSIYLMEIVPGAEEVITKIGNIFQAGWDAMSASYHKFIDSVKAGFVEIGNLAEASWEGVKGAGKGWWESAKTYLTLGIAGEKGAANPLHFMNRAGAGFNQALAGQQDAMKPGEDFASTFATKFQESLAKSEADAKHKPSLTDRLKTQRDEAQGWLEWDKALSARPGGPKDAFGGELGASFNKGTKDSEAAAKDKESSAVKSESAAALKGTQEANRIIMGGIASKDEKALKVAEQQLKVMENGFKTLASKAQETAGWLVANF